MKTILITGTTNGIGRVTAQELAAEGHHLVLANRNRDKAEQFAAELKSASGNDNISLLDLDLSSLKSVRECAAEFLSQHDTLDVLLNNAGMTSSAEVITEDGFESQFAINNLAQLLLTVELLPALEAAAPSQVIFVTSMMHKFGKIDFDSLKGGKKYNGNAAYSQSKLAMMLNAAELAKRLDARGVLVNTLHPGAVSTGILDEYPPLIRGLLRLVFTTPEKGARTSLHLAQGDPALLPTGKYFVNCKEAKPGKQLADTALCDKMWALSCEACGIEAAL
ncbi:SDR family oxidoreductase [Halieaceae bacterium IMCC14734]|uniref:SDR family oxidoreductase n=1 Tax=Candidatus Litorirhabdus singularis TaxID=2518993 RepID=A0ABT3TKB8_9GAMM|nr:SDR family oxidoreductase [Candidatus Litorirhabdus singularis]MCX2982753.1 SDR family oxidoreductase [Candidatus Litorirhabdus singularis]